MARNSGRALAGICIVGCFAVLCLPISNPDIYWHLSAARWMTEHGVVPRTDWLSHTMSGAPWSDFEWLTQLIWLGALRAGGFAGLWLLKVLLHSLGAYTLWRILGLYGAVAPLRGLGLFAWALGISPANDLRPENFSVLAFLLLWYLLEARRIVPQKKHSPWKTRGAIVALFVLWANLHAGFVYGLLLLGIYAVVEAAARRGRETAAWLAAAAGAALLNPYGVFIYGVLWEHWSALPVLERHIHEWQEASILSLWLRPFWAVFSASFAAVLFRYWERRDVPPEHLAVLCVFALSATAHVRTGVYFLSAAVPIAAAALSGGFLRDGRRVRAVFAAAFVSAGTFFAFYVLPPLLRLEVRRTDHVPVRLAEFLRGERAVLGGRKLFNPWHWGGYLGYALHPDYRVFVDGRYIFHHLLEPMNEARQSPERYAAFQREFATEVAVVRRTGQLILAQNMLRPFYLFYLPKDVWALVYWDAKGLVFVRRNAVPSAWLKAREYRHFRPGDLDAAARMLREGHVTAAELSAEIDRYFAAGGDAAMEKDVRRWLKNLLASAPS